MRVCDRHRDCESAETITFAQAKIVVDLCGGCAEEVREWLGRKDGVPLVMPGPVARRGRKPTRRVTQ